MNPSSNHANQDNPCLTLQSNEELKFAKFLMNHLTDAVFWFGRDAQFFYVNDTTCLWLGYSREELLSLKIHDVDLELPVETWSEWWGSLRHQGRLTLKSQYRTKAGEKLPMEVAFTYCLCQDKEFGFAFACDRTAEVELCQALEQERKYSQRRAEFNSILSHEIRNTLNLISFSTSLLRRHSQQWTEEERRLHLDGIQSVVEQINHLLDDVLLICKLEAGKLNFEPKPVDLHQFCCKLIAQMQLLGSASQHPISFISHGNYREASIDQKLLQPILMNLLDNAIKYSLSGSKVNLELSYCDDSAIIQIKDAGIGIPVTDLQRLFEPFYRGSNVGDLPGTGIGLVVVKKLLDLHGGQITVDSMVGKGTTFTVTLPLLS